MLKLGEDVAEVKGVFEADGLYTGLLSHDIPRSSRLISDVHICCLLLLQGFGVLVYTPRSRCSL